MTRRDFIVKWLAYGVTLLPIWWLETLVLNRFPILGVAPMLLPLAAAAVAVLEGTVAGAGFGLFVGMLCDAAYFGTRGTMTLGLCLLCCASGAAAQYVLRQGFWGFMLCSAGTLFFIDLGRVAVRTFTGAAPLPVLVGLALREILVSLCFTAVVYPLFRWVHSWLLKKLLLY